MGLFSGSGTETIVEEQILNSWSSLIQTGAGRGEKFYEVVKQFIDAAEIPGAIVEAKNVSTLSVQSRRQKESELNCLYIHGAVAGYDVYVAAIDYGKHLIVARYFVATPSAASLNLFNKEKLGAYLKLVHGGVIHATEQLMTELKLDLSKINKESTGSYIFSRES